METLFTIIWCVAFFSIFGLIATVWCTLLSRCKNGSDNEPYVATNSPYAPQNVVYVSPNAQGYSHNEPEIQYAAVSKTTYDEHGYPTVAKTTYENGHVTHESATYDGQNITYSSADHNGATYAKITPHGAVSAHRTNTATYVSVQKETPNGIQTVIAREPHRQPPPQKVFVQRTDTATYAAVQKQTPQGTITAVVREPHHQQHQQQEPTNVYVVRQY